MIARDPVSILSPAKINLFLAVTGKRPDGYHELITLMYPIDLVDRVKIELTRQGIAIACIHPDVPEDETNLAHRAAQLFLAHWMGEKGGRSFGVRTTIEKRIPVAAGLGGGSSNAATVLLVLNRMCGRPYTRTELAAMGLNLGSDVPFFIFQRPAIATGIGEILQPVTGDLKASSIILVHPPIRIRTVSVYQNLNLRLTKCHQQLKNSNLCIEDGLRAIPAGKVKKFLCNDLETIVLARYPQIEKIKQTLLKCGASGALMSGSGATVFGLFNDEAKAKSAFGHLDKEYPRNVFRVNRWLVEDHQVR